MTELLEIPRAEAEERVENKVETQDILEGDIGPYLEIPIIHDDPVVIATREGIIKEYRHRCIMKTRRWRVWLEAPLTWSEVPDVMMETEKRKIIPKAATKRKEMK